MSNTQLTATQKAWTQKFQLTEKLSLRPIDVKRLLGIEHVEVNEAILFLNKCKQYGADPFMNDMHLIKYSKTASPTIVTGVGLFQKKAVENPNFEGYGPTMWLDKNMKWVDCWIPSIHGKNPLACKASCYMKGWREAQTFVVNWEENHKSTNPWKSMPSRMLEKNALVGLLRSVLPSQVGGLYISEEINGEEMPEATVAPATTKLASPEKRETLNENLRVETPEKVFIPLDDNRPDTSKREVIVGSREKSKSVVANIESAESNAFDEQRARELAAEMIAEFDGERVPNVGIETIEPLEATEQMPGFDQFETEEVPTHPAHQ